MKMKITLGPLTLEQTERIERQREAFNELRALEEEMDDA